VIGSIFINATHSLNARSEVDEGRGELCTDTALLHWTPRLGSSVSAKHSPSFSFHVVCWVGLKRECGWDVR